MAIGIVILTVVLIYLVNQKIDLVQKPQSLQF